MFKYEIPLVLMNLDPISTAYTSPLIYISMSMKVVAYRRKIQIAFALVWNTWKVVFFYAREKKPEVVIISTTSIERSVRKI